MYINLFKNFETYKNIFDYDENMRKIDIFKFVNCIPCGLNLFYPNTLFKSDDNLILPLLEKTMSLNTTTIYEKNNMDYDYKETNNLTKYNCLLLH